VNGRPRPTATFLLPSALVLGIAWTIANADRPTMVLARLIAPPVLGLLLVLNLVVLAFRALSVFQAFTDHRYPGRPGRLGAVGLAVVLGVVALPHVAVWTYGSAAERLFANVFSGSPVSAADPSLAPTGPGRTERLDVLLIGVDSAPGRTEALTDSMIVVSLDPIGRSVSMVSIPRDLAGVPLAGGNVFGPKINSLLAWADRHPKDFPGGGTRTLEGATGALLGIPIHAYATVDLAGFVAMVDAVGGIDIDVRKALSDPMYPRLDGTRGWSVEPGLHHFHGADALAYARIRKAAGENDLTRAARQQEVLVALRNRAVTTGILLSLPGLLDAVGATVRTDLPVDLLPELAAMAEQIGSGSTTKLVLGAPFIKSAGETRYGSVFLPVPDKIAAMTRVVFGPPGSRVVWPPAPAPSAAPSSAQGGD
jgi:LCP family protein required for cell wall assembly